MGESAELWGERIKLLLEGEGLPCSTHAMRNEMKFIIDRAESIFSCSPDRIRERYF